VRHAYVTAKAALWQARVDGDPAKEAEASAEAGAIAQQLRSIGFETARALSAAGAAVLVAARDEQKAGAAARRIAELTGTTSVTPLVVDLADLASVYKAASTVTGPLDILVNNAGVMAVPELTRTRQGHETQFGVNYLGHFALTLGLHDALASAA
jgi:NAD(P)-dependent dehydrogenase (short-subunit alcohol dehydrogenase family)